MFVRECTGGYFILSSQVVLLDPEPIHERINERNFVLTKSEFDYLCVKHGAFYHDESGFCFRTSLNASKVMNIIGEKMFDVNELHPQFFLFQHNNGLYDITLCNYKKYKLFWKMTDVFDFFEGVADKFYLSEIMENIYSSKQVSFVKKSDAEIAVEKFNSLLLAKDMLNA